MRSRSRFRYLLLLAPFFMVHASAAHASITPSDAAYDTPPTPLSATSITMSSVVTTATDSSGNPATVTYWFSCVTCDSNPGTGCTPVSGQSSPTYTDTGLQPNKCYGYKVSAQTSSISQNENDADTRQTYTFANTPGAPTLTVLSDTTALLSNTENGNPASNPTTQFAVKLTSTSDSSWNNHYVDASGAPSATAVWLSDLAFDGLTITGLSPGTSYTAQSKARNSNNVETAFSPSTNMTTTGTGGGGGLVTRILRLVGGLRLRGGVRLE